ncbi:hypothetical protein [Collinsella aerofaciens]|uniref:hypothetical protein n=1 Tax=Collinsella aerofaciens TaxID=74426 RepID=UPI00189A913D|nr:hypothetical protein [Collinsella aerofaciens]
MYEKVWEGAAPGLDGTEWDLTFEFDESTGLFQVSGSVDGEPLDSYECADPVISGLMARSENDRPDDPYDMALIPPAPLEMQGRFAPFSSPDQIVSGTWRTPRDWPEVRKDETVRDLFMRRNDIVRLTDDVNPNQLAIKECSRLLNGMYGDPSKWPRRAVDSVLNYPRGTMPVNKYNDSGLFGCTLPPQFSAAVVRAGSVLEGRALDYRDAVYALYRKATCEYPYVDWEWEGGRCFGVIPSVDATQFIQELSEGDTVTLSLAASFTSFGGGTLELGDVSVNLKSADWYRKMFDEHELLHGALDVRNLGKLSLDEFNAYLRNCDSSHLYARWAGAFLDGEYGVDLEGETDRVLISAKTVAEFVAVGDYGLRHKAFAWEVVSWSKSEDIYYVEMWQAPKYLDKGLTSSEQAWKEWDITFDSFPSDYIPDMRTMPMTMDGEPGAFVNARYAIDPDRLLRGHSHEGTRNKTVPGTAALKENLAKLDQKAKVNQSSKKESRGWHV